MEYIVFTDESYITDSRFQSLSAFSLPFAHYEELKANVSDLLKESDVFEFKWEKLKDAKYFFCAEKLINLIFQYIYKYTLRIDTLIWDTHDSRHNISHRDDLANYERMFFHLLSNAMKKRLRGSKWHIRPDVRGGIDWSTIHDCLYCAGKKREYKNTIFGSFFTDPFFVIESFEEKQSHEEVLIQIPDLFSGLSVFSRANYCKYQIWKSQNTPSLFSFNEEEKLSNREKYRCKLLNFFNNKCKQLKLGVSLDTNKCLNTFNPKSPLSFWHYEPQGDYDKAPVGK